MFPRKDARTDFWGFFGVNLASSLVATGFTYSALYPFDFARTRLAADVGGKETTFNGMIDCLKKTSTAQGTGAIYSGFGASIASRAGFRGL
jgi:solute carrier family 25 (adenine nucleotide translocator) protein 4/5/6/31